MNVGEMQRKLSQRAAREPDQRFGDLYSLLYNREWLLAAWHQVRQNAGSRTAGSDGVDKRRFEADFDTHFEALRTTLKAGTFEPLPATTRPPGSERPDRARGAPYDPGTDLGSRLSSALLRVPPYPVHEGRDSVP